MLTRSALHSNTAGGAEVVRRVWFGFEMTVAGEFHKEVKSDHVTGVHVSGSRLHVWACVIRLRSNLCCLTEQSDTLISPFLMIRPVGQQMRPYCDDPTRVTLSAGYNSVSARHGFRNVAVTPEMMYRCIFEKASRF